MTKLWLVGLVVFIVTMIAPELRGLMVVSGVSVMIGMMIGLHHATHHTAELYANRAERVAMRTIEA